MVALSEIDSFIWKFKQLLYSGRNAHLDIKSELGKAIVHLNAEVDVNVHQEQHRAQPRNGPARQRRREKRAVARDAAENETHQLDSSAPVKVVENTNAKETSEEDTLENVDS